MSKLFFMPSLITFTTNIFSKRSIFHSTVIMNGVPLNFVVSVERSVKLTRWVQIPCRSLQPPTSVAHSGYSWLEPTFLAVDPGKRNSYYSI